MNNPLLRMVQARVAGDELCARIDAGELQLTELQMAEFAMLVNEHGGLLKHDLLCKIASRCKNGQAALRKMAQ